MKNQRSSVIVYALVALVLFGALAGSIWWVKERNTPASVVTDDQAQQQTTDTEVKQDETAKPEEAATAASEPADEQTAPETTQPQSGTQSGTGTTNNDQPQRAADTAAPANPESQTPRTGPSPEAVAASGPLENAVLTSLALGGFAFAGTSYVRSRRSRS